MAAPALAHLAWPLNNVAASVANVLPDKTVGDIKILAAKGLGVRAISRALGIDRKTVNRYYPKHTNPKCNCGRPAGHNGWCKWRFAHSAARQAFWYRNSRHKISIQLPPKLSRRKAIDKTRSRWLGLSHPPQPVQYMEMYSIIGEVRHATRKFPVELREDITQEIIVRALDGYIQRGEIVNAAKWFMLREWARINNKSLSIDQICDGAGYERFMVGNPWDHAP